MPIDLSTTEFLLSREGAELLEYAKSLAGDLLTRLTTLRKRYPPEVSSAALELLELRHRAVRKFSRSDDMFFVREALEQASSETISCYRAERFPEGATVLDLGCGIGGDTIGLASRGPVIAVDRDPVRLAMARRNIEVYGLSNRVQFVRADITEIPLKADAAFLDPSRRAEGRRLRHLADLSPSIDFIERLIREIPDCAIKLSPGTPDEELDALGGEIEFVSEGGECKEAVAWFGCMKTADRRATVLPQRATITRSPVEPVEVREPGRYLIEPDACVVRAHLVEQFAHDIGAWKIEDLIAYLSADQLVESPLGDAYEILESMPFNPKAVNRHLREMDAGKIIVKKRGVPFEPEEVERRMKLTGSKEFVLVLTRIRGKAWALICRTIPHQA